MRTYLIIAAVVAIVCGLISASIIVPLSTKLAAERSTVASLRKQLSDEQTAHTTTKTNFANYQIEVEKNARLAMEQDRLTEAKWRTTVKELDNQWSNKYATLKTKYDRLDSTARSVSGQLATFTAASKELSQSATTAAEREAVSAAFDLLSVMYGELGDREATLAKALDRSYGEGKACEAFVEVTDAPE